MALTNIKRGAFLMLAAAPLLTGRARAQSDADPASSSTRPALRVLLGSGDAAASSGGMFTYNGRFYRGSFTRDSGGRVVNLVDVEEYLYSVVPSEMAPRWPAPALQAQAICSRTYVLQRSDPRRTYDLVPSELNQVYHGVAGESADATAAVDATAGQVLTFNGAFAQVAYSSCCGGHTEASAEAWNTTPIPYLQGVVCTWCGDSPNYRWNATLALEAIAARYAAQVAPFGNLTSIAIAGRDDSGRARSFTLLGQHGSLTVRGSAFRMAVGPRTLRSLLVLDLQPSLGGDVAVYGGGLGHGVGLCQWGARGMALQNRRAEEILAQYFPQTKVDYLNR
ncbi:MAG TPA: SpoIID/LytB domain-containing protein [Candidatus Cybelea sp.]